MARKARKISGTGIYHIILRGNDQQNIFYDDSDKHFFISRIKKYSKETNLVIYSYCLMDNHVHLLIGNGNEEFSMARFVKKLACSYVYRFNHKYNHTGHLFQGRYKSEAIETVEYFKIAYRYILQNPEKANICLFNKYQWNSYKLETKQSFIDHEYIKTIFGGEQNRISFLHCENIDICMENTTVQNTTYNDDEIKTCFIKQLFNIEDVHTINKESIQNQKEKIRTLKACGLSINQIARITNINRNFIKLA